jgi:anti-sigma B factor antagonist
MPLQIESKVVGDVCVLTPEGKIVIGDEVGAMREKIKEALQAGHKNILVSLEKVNYMDSTGVGALVGSFTTIRGQGGQLKLASLSQRTRDILLVTKLLTVFDVYENEADGIKSFAAKKS